MSGNRVQVTLKETLCLPAGRQGGAFPRLTPAIDIFSHSSSGSQVPVTIPSGDPPCGGSKRTASVRPPPVKELHEIVIPRLPGE
jgi:hypothetical protein